MTTKKTTSIISTIASLVTLAATTIALSIHKRPNTVSDPDLEQWENDWEDDYEEYHYDTYEEMYNDIYTTHGLRFKSNGDGTCTVIESDAWGADEINIPPYSPDGDTVTAIGDCAFKGHINIMFVTMPDTVTSIGYGAFYNCTGLTSITIPGSVTEIDDYAFSGCTALKNITIPKSLVRIGGHAFWEWPEINVEWWEDELIF